jgi:ParB-like chromosome segregation protein Spo0J
MELTLHPLCTYFPRIGSAGFHELKADIVAHGLLHPIVLYEGKILDGGNRYRACVEAGIDPEVVEYDGDDPAAFVCSSNVHRRNMTLGQRAIAVANAANWAKAQRVGRPKAAADATLQTAPRSLAPASAPSATPTRWRAPTRRWRRR